MTSGLQVHIVDDDDAIRDSVAAILTAAGFSCATYDSAATLLDQLALLSPGCALIDVRMPGMDGLALLHELNVRKSALPVIMMTGFADVPVAVKAMKAGATDFVEKPCTREQLVAAVEQAFARTKASRAVGNEKRDAQEKIARLTQREREVLDLLVAGDPNKIVAHKLGISPRTVEIHRGRLMEKTKAKSLAELVRLALAASDKAEPT